MSNNELTFSEAVTPRNRNLNETATGSTITASAIASRTTVETITEPRRTEVLRLTLRPRPTVTWEESVQDNEGMGRKSSKRCCIFHKQRAFGESSTDSSDSSDSSSSGDHDDSSSSSHGKKKVARRKKHGKNKNTVPNFQRFHA